MSHAYTVTMDTGAHTARGTGSTVERALAQLTNTPVWRRYGLRSPDERAHLAHHLDTRGALTTPDGITYTLEGL